MRRVCGSPEDVRAETNAQALSALLSAPPRAVTALEKCRFVRVNCALLLQRAG